MPKLSIYICLQVTRLSKIAQNKNNLITFIITLWIFLFGLSLSFFFDIGSYHDNNYNHINENVISPFDENFVSKTIDQDADVTSTRSNGNTISLAFFFDPYCDCTYDAIYVLDYIKTKYTNVEQYWYNISYKENETKMNVFQGAYNVPTTIRYDTPFIFIGDYYLNNTKIQNESLSSIIEKYSDVDVPLWPEWKIAWTVHLAFFYNPEDQSSQTVIKDIDILNKTWNSEFPHLIIHDYSLNSDANSLLFDAYYEAFNLSIETQYSNIDDIFAGVFTGDDFLLNTDINFDSLNNTMKKHSGTNTPLHDISPDISGGDICLLFFFSHTCGDCHKAIKILEDMKGKYPDLDVQEYNIANLNNELLKQSYYEYYDVPEGEQGVLAVFIGDYYFTNVGSLDSGIEDAIKENLNGCDCPDVEPDKEIVIDKFKNFPLLYVILAGLIDGLNPCAFATLIFFITYLFSTGRTKKQILIIGLAFTLGVFITYMALGIGLYQLFHSLEQVALVSMLIYPVMGVITLCFGFYSLHDFNKARTGRKEDIKLQLPSKIKSLIGRVIKEQAKIKYFTFIAVFTGVLISLFEFMCTGQIYLPTIMLVIATAPELKAQAIFMLLLYNIMFILPLIIIFTSAYFGVRSIKFQGFLDKNRALIKLLTAILFFVLGIFLIVYSIQFF